MPKIIETPTLETDRLILRPHKEEDCQHLQKYFNNWNIIKVLNENIPWPYPDDGQLNHYLENLKPQTNQNKNFAWVLCLKEKPEHPIGCINYIYKNKTPDDNQRGFWLAEPYWGQGYMSEAVSAANDFIFDQLNIVKMTLTNNATNIGSRRVKEKTGAKLIEITQEKWRDTTIDVEVWELTAENWRKFKEENTQ